MGKPAGLIPSLLGGNILRQRTKSPTGKTVVLLVLGQIKEDYPFPTSPRMTDLEHP
jgi:hypothetical protein